MKSNWYLWALIAAVSVSFAIIAFFLWLSGGENKYLLSKKLQIGALLISMTGIINGCRPPVVTCYEVAVEPIFNCVDSVDNDGNIVILQNDERIEFDCEFMFYKTVTYRMEKLGGVVANDSCQQMSVDQKTRLTVNLPQNLACGNYDLKLYYYSLSELRDDSTPFQQFNVKIIDDGK